MCNKADQVEKALDKLGIPTERIRTIVINDGMEQNPELLAGLKGACKTLGISI